MSVSFRDATESDVAAIVGLLADDPLGAAREGAAPEVYRSAFARIAANPLCHLIVGAAAGQIVATCQLTLLHGLSRGGMTRAVIEAVRVAPGLRSQGIGAALIAEAEARARAAGAGMIQLTTDKNRTRAHAFYEGLGYVQSHFGYKKTL